MVKVQHWRHRVLVAAVLTMVVVGGSAALASGGQAGESDPTVTISDTTVEVGNTATVAVELSSVPSGIAGYDLELTLSGTAANVSGATYPGTFELTEGPTVGSDGATLQLRASNLKGAPREGATNVTLARVNITGQTPGTAEIGVAASEIEDTNGSRIRPSTVAGTVTVESASSSGGGSAGGGQNPGQTTNPQQETATEQRTVSQQETATATSDTPATGDRPEGTADRDGTVSPVSTTAGNATTTAGSSTTTSGSGPGFGSGVGVLAICLTTLCALSRRSG